MISELKFKDHDEWLAIRHKYIGGSEAGAVLGMNPYKSAYTLWAEKTDRVPEFGGNLTTKVGAYLEQMVADLFTEETGKKVRKRNCTFVNDAFPWACANIDRAVIGEDAILECKTTNSLPVMRQVKGGEYPDTWYCQMTHYLAVTGKQRAYLAVLVNCREFHTYILERDEDEIKALMDAESAFWDHVKNDTPPDVDGSENCSDTLGDLYPNGGISARIDMTGYTAAFREYEQAIADEKEVKSRKTHATNLLKEALGDREYGATEDGNYKVTWKPQVKETLDKKKLAAEHPDIDISKYMKKTTTRVMRVTCGTEKKGK